MFANERMKNEWQRICCFFSYSFCREHYRRRQRWQQRRQWHLTDAIAKQIAREIFYTFAYWTRTLWQNATHKFNDRVNAYSFSRACWAWSHRIVALKFQFILDSHCLLCIVTQNMKIELKFSYISFCYKYEVLRWFHFEPFIFHVYASKCVDHQQYTTDLMELCAHFFYKQQRIFRYK